MSYRRSGICAVLGAMLLGFALVPGIALADPAGLNQSWTYSGATPGWETIYKFTYSDSASPLKIMDFQIFGNGPTTYSFSSIKLTVNGTAVANACAPVTGGSAPTIGCNFANGAVSDGAKVTLFSDETPTVPQGSNAFVFLQDWAGKTASNTVPGPVPLVPQVGKPFIIGSRISGLKIDKPHLAFTLHKGKNAPEIKGFRIELPSGLRYEKFSHPSLSFRWSHHAWSCMRESGEYLWCSAKKPVSTASVAIGWPTLIESKALERKVRRRKNVRLAFGVRVEDVDGTETYVPQMLRAH